MNQSQVPELMKLSAIPTDLEQKIDTDIIDPVVFSQSFCRFTLPRKGFLHSFSSLVLALEKPSANPNATYPTNIGVHSLVERATLKVGGKTICEIEDFNNYMGYKSMFIDNDINQERESVISGRITAHQMSFPEKSDKDATSYTIDNNTYKFNSALLAAPFTKVFTPTYSAAGQASASFVEAGYQVKDNLLLVNAPELRISLADLFPFLRFNQLPLYMIDEDVSVEIVWTPQDSTRRFCCQDTGSDPTERLNITQNSVKLVGDFIFYDGQTMSDYASANKDMTFNFVDYRLTKRTYAFGETSQQILNIGGAGRIVNKVFVAMGQDSASNVGLLNTYISQAPSLSGSNVGRLTTNVRYNDHYLYPIDRTLGAIQFHDIVQTEQNLPYISKDEYNQEGGGTGGGGLNTTTGEGYNGLEISTEWRGKYNYQAHRLNRNERINSRGIELETQYNLALTGGDNYTQRVWIELMKTAELRDGKMDIYFS